MQNDESNLPQSEEISLYENDDLFGGSVFACCHLYRECSNAKRCLSTDQEKAKLCAYRKNLEIGNIYFGKNSINFDEKKYQEFKDRVEALPYEAKVALETLLIDYCGQHRGVGSVVVRNRFIDELANIGLFNFEPIGTKMVFSCVYTKLLNKLEKLDATAFQTFQEKKKLLLNQRKQLKKTTPDDARQLDKNASIKLFRHWLNTEAVEIRDKLAEPYRLAVPKAETKIYIEELWMRVYFKTWDRTKWWLQPLAEDDLIGQTEIKNEIKRLKKIAKAYSK